MSASKKSTSPRGRQEVIEEPFPDFKLDPKEKSRWFWSPEDYEKRRAKTLSTPLP